MRDCSSTPQQLIADRRGHSSPDLSSFSEAALPEFTIAQCEDLDWAHVPLETPEDTHSLSRASTGSHGSHEVAAFDGHRPHPRNIRRSSTGVSVPRQRDEPTRSPPGGCSLRTHHQLSLVSLGNPPGSPGFLGSPKLRSPIPTSGWVDPNELVIDLSRVRRHRSRHTPGSDEAPGKDKLTERAERSTRLRLLLRGMK